MADERYTYLAKGKYPRFRHPTTGDVSLPLPVDSSQYFARYAELKALVEERAVPKTLDRQTFQWLTRAYRDSAEFKTLRPSTQTDYEKTLDIIDDKLGEVRFQFATRKIIKAVRDEFAATPRKAHKIKQMVSGLYSWADANDYVSEGFNPVASMKRLKGRAKPITVWSEEEIAMFLPRAGQSLTGVMLALYTGQRREDVVNMTWRDYQGAFIRVRQSKTGEPLDIACHPKLRAYLDGLRGKGFGKIVRNANGKPMTANALSQALRRDVSLIEAMPVDRSMHGLRYAAAGRLNEAGASVSQCIAVLGHRTWEQAVAYMRQRQDSKDAMAQIA